MQDEAELPFGRDVVRRSQDVPFEPCGLRTVIGAEASGHLGRKGRQVRLQPLADPVVQSFARGAVLHQLVEHRRTDVRDDDAVQKLEDSPLDQSIPVHLIN